MRECLECGKGIPFRKERGHREREYCSDKCRQRACRARKKPRRSLDQIIAEAHARMWDKVEQDFRRETWQDDLKAAQEREEMIYRWWKEESDENDRLQARIELLEYLLAEKDAEITRLNYLLESQARRKHR